MKKTRTRQRSHRTSTPSVICLPPPKPPTVAPRREPEVERAMGLPETHEPLVAASAGRSGSRQARRRAKRTEAKTVRGHTSAVTESPATPPPELAPLPRSQALAKPPSGMLARVEAWFSRLIPRKRQPASVPQEALAQQMIALRSELAMVQNRLDRVIKAVSHH